VIAGGATTGAALSGGGGDGAADVIVGGGGEGALSALGLGDHGVERFAATLSTSLAGGAT
jgi:hypothetical protein